MEHVARFDSRESCHSHGFVFAHEQLVADTLLSLEQRYSPDSVPYEAELASDSHVIQPLSTVILSVVTYGARDVFAQQDSGGTSTDQRNDRDRRIYALYPESAS